MLRLDSIVASNLPTTGSGDCEPYAKILTGDFVKAIGLIALSLSKVACLRYLLMHLYLAAF